MNKKNNKLAITDYLWIILITFLVLGWFYPVIGLIAVICKEIYHVRDTNKE